MNADPKLHYKTPLRETPFHPRTSAHNRLNQWGAWGGFTTALAFEDEAMEYTAIRNASAPWRRPFPSAGAAYLHRRRSLESPDV